MRIGRPKVERVYVQFTDPDQKSVGTSVTVYEAKPLTVAKKFQLFIEHFDQFTAWLREHQKVDENREPVEAA